MQAITEEYLKLIHIKEEILDLCQSFDPDFDENNINFDALMEDVGMIMEEMFTIDELIKMVALYSTPLGATIKSVEPDIYRRIQAVLMKHLEED